MMSKSLKLFLSCLFGMGKEDALDFLLGKQQKLKVPTTSALGKDLSGEGLKDGGRGTGKASWAGNKEKVEKHLATAVKFSNNLVSPNPKKAKFS